MMYCNYKEGKESDKAKRGVNHNDNRQEDNPPIHTEIDSNTNSNINMGAGTSVVLSHVYTTHAGATAPFSLSGPTQTNSIGTGGGGLVPGSEFGGSHSYVHLSHPGSSNSSPCHSPPISPSPTNDIRDTFNDQLECVNRVSSEEMVIPVSKELSLGLLGRNSPQPVSGGISSWGLIPTIIDQYSPPPPHSMSSDGSLGAGPSSNPVPTSYHELTSNSRQCCQDCVISPIIPSSHENSRLTKL